MSDPEIVPGLRRLLDLPDGERPAAAVRSAVLRAARQTVPAERAGPGVRASVAPYRAEAAKLRHLLAGFNDRRQWDVPVPAAGGWTVLDLLAHLTAVDAVLLAGLAPGLDPAREGLDPAELLDRTVALQRVQRHRPPHETLGLWWSQVEDIGDQIAAAGPVLLDRPVAFAGGPLPVRDLLVDRAFETWIHADDVRVGTGGAPVRPAADHLAAMVEFAVRVLRQVLAGQAADGPSGRVSLVLAGDGGTWDLPVGADPRTGGSATLTVDVIGFCKLLAARETVDELPWTVTGDERLGRAVLATAASMARP